MKTLMLCLIVPGLLAVAPLQPSYGQPGDRPSATPNAAVRGGQPPAQSGATASDIPTQHPAAAPSALDIMLVLDNSGSMKQNDPHLLTREVVTRFLEGMGANTRLGMVVFDQDARLIEPLTALDSLNTRVRFLKGLESLNYQGRYTNSPAAIERALYELKSHGREQASRIVIFLTDGIVDTGDQARDRQKEQWLKDSLTAESRRLGIRLFTIAFTDRADYQLIQTMALNTAGEYFRAYRAEEIEGVFQAIRERLVPTPAPPAAVAAPVQPPAPSPPPAAPGPSPAAAPSPPPPEPGLPLPLLLAGAVALVGIVGLGLVLRRTSRGRGQGAGPAPAGGTAGEPPLPQADLLDLKGAVFQGPVRLTQHRVRIGRTSDNDIVIPGEGVSALHATICYQNGAFYLEDQRSSNGTWLNDGKERLEPGHPVLLKSGDRIRFDTCELKFLAAQQPIAGGTVLDQNRAQGPTGTVLSRPGADALASGSDAASPASSPGPDRTAPQETRLKKGMCPKHPSVKATELCSVCQQAFCAMCVSEQEGEIICNECREKMAPSGPTPSL